MVALASRLLLLVVVVVGCVCYCHSDHSCVIDVVTLVLAGVVIIVAVTLVSFRASRRDLATFEAEPKRTLGWEKL